MSISAPRLRQSRHGVFVFRYLVPPPFVEKLGKKELRRSLRTKNSQIAKIIALHLNALIEKALKDLKPEIAMDEIKKLLAAGVYSFKIKTKSKEITTDGTKEDAESFVASIENPKFRAWIDSDIAEGEKVTVTVIDPADQSISSLFRDPVAKPMSIESARGCI
jgi:LEA14-like dessication related protein